MRPADILCGSCKRRYSDTQHGCGTCLRAKNNIIWPAMDKPLLGYINAQAIRIIENELERLETEQRDSIGGRHGYSTKERVQSISALTRALTSCISEGRKLEDAEARRAAQMTVAEKCELFIEFFLALPEGQQRQLMGELVDARRQLPAYSDAELVEDSDDAA